MSYESKIADFTIDDKMGGDQKVSLLKVVLLIWYSNRNTILQILPTYKHLNVGQSYIYQVLQIIDLVLWHTHVCVQ